MRLAVYAIFKNEERNMQAFLDAIMSELRPEDSITLVDTGATDDTVRIITTHEALVMHPNSDLQRVSIQPWRFDAARNAALMLVPDDMDMAWALDIDERPAPGWREQIEQAYNAKPDAHRIRYRFVWDHNEDGSDGIVFHADKLHRRHGFVWKGIAHEWLVWVEKANHENHMVSDELVVHHYQDTSLNRRERDMALMERAIAELPDDERLQHYYARQLLICGREVEASEAFQRHLANPKATWAHERAESMMYLAGMGGNDAWKHQWYYRALAECPWRRETWWSVAEWEASQGNDELAIAFFTKCAQVSEDMYYLSRPAVRGDAPLRRAEELWRKVWEEQPKAEEVLGVKPE